MNEDEYLKGLLLSEAEDEEEKELVKLLVKEEKPSIVKNLFSPPMRRYYDEAGKLLAEELASGPEKYTGAYDVRKVEMPFGTRIIEAAKREWELHAVDWISVAMATGIGAVLNLPVIQARRISQTASRFAVRNLNALRKKFPATIKSLADAKRYAELAMRGYFGKVTSAEYWLDMTPMARTQMISKACKVIDKITLSPETAQAVQRMLRVPTGVKGEALIKALQAQVPNILRTNKIAPTQQNIQQIATYIAGKVQGLPADTATNLINKELPTMIEGLKVFGEREAPLPEVKAPVQPEGVLPIEVRARPGEEITVPAIAYEWTCEADAPDLCSIINEAIASQPSTAPEMKVALAVAYEKRLGTLTDAAETEFASTIKEPQFIKEVMQVARRPEVKAAPIVKDAEEIQLRGFIEASTQFASVTQSQLHRINSLAESMNYNPRRMQRLLTLFASTTELDKLSTEEADIVVRAMEAIPLSAHTKIPRIPTDIDIDKMSLLGFFEKGKRGVGVIGALGIPAWRAFDIMGATKEVYDPIMKGYIDKIVEQHSKRDYYKTLVNEGMVATDLPRKQVDSLLFEYINGTLPKGTTLPSALEEIGKKARVILDEFADRIGLPPERRLQNYIFHMFEHALRPDAGKTVPEEVLTAFAGAVPGKVFTATLLERLGKEQGLVRSFTRAMNTMTAINLRKIHLEPAFEEAQKYAQYYPEASQKFIKEWIDVTILKRPADIDMYIANTLRPVDDFLIKASKGRLSLGTNPSKTLAYIYTRIGYTGLMAFNLALAGKNVTQQMLTIPLLANPANYVLAWKDLMTPRGKLLLRQCQLLKERFPGLEGVNTTDVNWWLKIGMIPYKSADYLNVSIAFLAGYRDAEAKGFAPEEAAKYADRLAKTAQWSYRLPDMPGYIFRGGGPGRVIGMLTTWADNYFGSYLPELFYRLYTGKDTEGNPVNKAQRAGIRTHILTSAAFIYTMYKYRKVDFRKILGPGVLPTYITPGLMNFIHLGQIMLGSQEESDRAKQQLERNVKRFFIPTGLQSLKIHSALRNIADGFEKDSRGRFRRITSLEGNITAMITYSAEKSEYWTVQETVWDLDAKINSIQKDITKAAMKGNRAKIQSLLEKAQRLVVKRNDFMKQLANLKQGLPRGKEDDLIRSLKELYLPRWMRKFTL